MSDHYEREPDGRMRALEAEVERLREEVKTARRTGQFHKDNHFAAEAEVERLRAAIGEWADMNAAKDSTIKDLVEAGDRLAAVVSYKDKTFSLTEWAAAKRAAPRGGE